MDEVFNTNVPSHFLVLQKLGLDDLRKLKFICSNYDISNLKSNIVFLQFQENSEMVVLGGLEVALVHMAIEILRISVCIFQCHQEMYENRGTMERAETMRHVVIGRWRNESTAMVTRS